MKKILRKRQERGVVVEYKGKYWGTEYDDGNSRSENWGPIQRALVSDPKYCDSPDCHTYQGEYSRRADELKKGRLVPITVTTVTEYAIDI